MPDLRMCVARINLWAVVGLLLMARSASALDPERAVTQYTLTTWDVDAGLPQSSVSAIAQSADGYLWLGTQEGLVRFDGSRFAVVDRRSHPELPHNFITALAPRRAGGLWVGTYAGLTRYEGGHVHPVPLPAVSRLVTSILEDRDGVLWVGTSGSGVVRVAGTEVTALSVGEGLPHGLVRGLHQDASGAVWVGTDGGLARWSGERFERVPSPAGVQVRSLAHDAEGGLWVGTTVGAEVYRDGTWSSPVALRGAAVTAIVWDRHGNGWFAATGRGLLRLRDDRVEAYGPAEGMTSDDVITVFEDRAGTLWIGSNGAGFSRLEDAPIIPVGAPEGLARDSVFAVLESHDGSMWVGTNGGGLDHIVDGQITHLTTADGLSSNFIAALHEASDHSLWIGTRGHGLHRLDGGTLEHHGRAQGLDGTDIFVVAEDEAHRILVGTNIGLYAREPGARRFVRVEAVPRDVITAIEVEGSTRVWVGTQSHGLLRLSGAEVEVFAADRGLDDAFVTTLLRSARGDLWIGTSAGLARLREGRIRTFGAADGLDENLILGLVDDPSGYLWMTTNRGIARAAWSELEAVAAGGSTPVRPLRLDVPDGMRSSECNGGFHPAGLRTHEGLLWFPTMRGLIEIDPRRLDTARPVPNAVIETLAAHPGLDADPDEPVASPRDAELRYTAIALDRSNELRFRYQLVGFDKNWVDAGERRVAYYTNLPPGKYEFMVVACRDGACSAEPAKHAVIIRPYYYETGWFYGACALALLSVTWGVYRLRVRQMRDRARWLEAKIHERTQDLESEVQRRAATEVELIEAKDRAEAARTTAEAAQAEAERAARTKGEFLANMSHEIRTPMNAVLGMTDLVLGTELDEGQRSMLGIAREAADGLMTVLNDILDISKIDSGMMVISPIPFALRERLEGVLSVVRFRTQAKGLELTLEVAEDVEPRLVGDPDRLRQILINLLSNATKFTHIGGITVKVSIAERVEGQVVLSIAVRDTGVGIPTERLAAIFDPFEQADGSSTRRFGGTGLGLSIARRLAELMGGGISVESTLGVGSCFELRVRMDVAAAPAPRAAQPVARPLTRSLEVLLAEDNKVNQMLAVRILEKQGHKVVVAGTGREAVDAWRERRFDVILMDVHMPEMDGLDATRTIRQDELGGATRTPIVALTAAALQEDRDRCMDAGMDAYLTKPVRAEGLLETLAAAVPAARGEW